MTKKAHVDKQCSTARQNCTFPVRSNPKIPWEFAKSEEENPRGLPLPQQNSHVLQCHLVQEENQRQTDGSHWMVNEDAIPRHPFRLGPYSALKCMLQKYGKGRKALQVLKLVKWDSGM